MTGRVYTDTVLKQFPFSQAGKQGGDGDGFCKQKSPFAFDYHADDDDVIGGIPFGAQDDPDEIERIISEELGKAKKRRRRSVR